MALMHRSFGAGVGGRGDQRGTKSLRIISKAFLGLILTLVLVVFSLVAIGNGWVPTIGNKYTEVYFGEKPRGWVLWHASGWTDHKIFFIFTADSDWVNRAVEFGNLDGGKEMSRKDCMLGSNPPWWFRMSQDTQGVCWERREGYAGNLKLHYSPETRFVYAFDFSS